MFTYFMLPVAMGVGSRRLLPGDEALRGAERLAGDFEPGDLDSSPSSLASLWALGL